MGQMNIRLKSRGRRPVQDERAVGQMNMEAAFETVDYELRKRNRQDRQRTQLCNLMSSEGLGTKGGETNNIIIIIISIIIIIIYIYIYMYIYTHELRVSNAK